MAIKRMPIYGIIGIFRKFLTHYLAKYQYFSMRPSVFDYYYQVTYYLKVLARYLNKCAFYIEKNQKFHKISHISICAFCPIAVTKMSTLAPFWRNFPFGSPVNSESFSQSFWPWIPPPTLKSNSAGKIQILTQINIDFKDFHRPKDNFWMFKNLFPYVC